MKNPASARLLVAGLFAFALLGATLTGCVSTNPEKELGIEDLPPDMSAVFVAVPWEVPGDTSVLRLAFDDDNVVQLMPEAINKVVLKPGWYQMDLTELPQPDENVVMRYRFDPGEVYRYTIMERKSNKPDTLVAEEWEMDPELEQLTYVIVPSTQDAFEQLLIEDAFPVVETTP